MQTFVRVQYRDGELLELLHRLAHAGLDRLLQHVVALPEAVRERKQRHRRSPWPLADTACAITRTVSR